MNTPTYHLQKYNGPSTRYTCPSCGAKHRFTRYVDAYGWSQHPSVGRCDRESACGYHKTPRDYFAEHPTITRHAGLDPASPAVMPGSDRASQDRASQTLATILHRVPIPADLQPNLLGLIADFELEYL